MRMDNETYRLKVEGLLGELKRSGENLETDVADELRELALVPRKARYFLRALLTTEQTFYVQVHFYRHVLSAAKSKDAYRDLERHIRHAFYEAREITKEVLAEMDEEVTLDTLLHVIVLTEEGWLAGELIRIVLNMAPDKLTSPLRKALQSKDYLLQCLAIYLIGKSHDETLLHTLADFYSNPVGEKIERLQQKSHDSLVEGAEKANTSVLTTWLQHRSSRVRDLALTMLMTRSVPETAVGLVRLILLDAKTRNRAAQVLQRYKENDVFTWEKSSTTVQDIKRLLHAAKEPALSKLLHTLLRDENGPVRGVAVELARLLQNVSAELSGRIRLMAVEDPLPEVQMAALQAVADIDPDRLVSCLIEVYADHGFGQGSPELVELANGIMEERLVSSQVMQVQEGIRQKKERRAAALERFAGTVEWWRHEG